ncbi:hypothetical protein NCS52_00992600 [Fusarium sp. LHS14.1]|nr:hypothetical protein NCS52_00992600 [Fusarium sp. LHS14.1]
MATPASDSTEWDPLGPNAPAGNALVVLRPKNAAAKLAFSDVVDFIKEQDNDDGHGLRSRFSRYIWFSDEQVYDPAVSRLVNHQLKLSLDGSSSPSSGTSSDHFSQDVRICTGFFFLDSNIPPLIQRLGWSVGRLSQKNVALGRANVDLLLTTSRSSQVARRHAFISFSAETRLARVSLESGSSVTNSVSFEDLRYTLEYTPHCHRPEGQAGLGEYVNALHGDDQPTKEALLATPTPTLNSQTIGKYSVTGLIGMGSFGRVRPATDPQRDQLVAIKTIEVRANSAQAIRRKLDLMDNLSTLANAEKQTNMLKVIETIHVPGARIDEFHVILEPFVEITFDKMPQGTQSALYQISEHAGVHRDPVCDFLTYAFRFSGSKVGGQRRPRPTGAACLETLFAQSECLRTRTSSEQALVSTPTSTSNTGGAKRPAGTESRGGQVLRQRSETNCPMHGQNET